MTKLPHLLILLLLGGSAWAATHGAASQAAGSLEIRSVSVNGNSIPLHSGGEVSLGALPQKLSFEFGPPTNANWTPRRLRYKLEGYDTVWREGGGDMFLMVRFCDEAGEQISQKIFTVSGDSAGWSGSVKNSTFTHRRETLVVPPQASRLFVVISSAGPPSTVGLYLVDNLVASRIQPNGVPETLLRSPFDRGAKEDGANPALQDWIRDGTRPSMAKIMDLGLDPPMKAFAIVDDDPIAHAEWHNSKETAPRVAPGDQLMVEWNELFSMGVADVRSAYYEKLPPGVFRFRIAEVTPLGVPTGVEASVGVRVPLPFWEMSWFWATLVMVLITAATLGSRSIASYKMRREVAHLKQLGALEQERLRIARDIHDDLGARVTQMSLLSAMAQNDPALPEKARADFDRISRMSRELVSALYETVWVVNPENDNLDALGNYLCQVANQLCGPAQLRCRLDVLELPRDLQVSSQIRHNIAMVVNESVHNVIKHAAASEVTLRVAFADGILSLSIEDNGCGFDPAIAPPGNGLANMKRRLEDIGGACVIESQPGKGTVVRAKLSINRSSQARGLWNLTML